LGKINCTTIKKGGADDADTEPLAAFGIPRMNN